MSGVSCPANRSLGVVFGVEGCSPARRSLGPFIEAPSCCQPNLAGFLLQRWLGHQRERGGLPPEGAAPTALRPHTFSWSGLSRPAPVAFLFWPFVRAGWGFQHNIKERQTQRLHVERGDQQARRLPMAGAAQGRARPGGAIRRAAAPRPPNGAHRHDAEGLDGLDKSAWPEPSRRAAPARC